MAALVAYQTGSSVAANEVLDATSLASTALVRGYGRDMELEADELGAAYLAQAGYDPQATAEVIGILKDHETSGRLKARETGEKYQGYHGLFSTHPRNDQRLQKRHQECRRRQDRPGNQKRQFGISATPRDLLKYSDESAGSARSLAIAITTGSLGLYRGLPPPAGK